MYGTQHDTCAPRRPRACGSSPKGFNSWGDVAVLTSCRLDSELIRRAMADGSVVRVVRRNRQAGGSKQESRVIGLTAEILVEHFSSPLEVAARNLGVCPTSLKRSERTLTCMCQFILLYPVCSACRKMGIRSWPYRQISKLLTSRDRLHHETPLITVSQDPRKRLQTIPEPITRDNLETISLKIPKLDECLSPSLLELYVKHSCAKTLGTLGSEGSMIPFHCFCETTFGIPSEKQKDQSRLVINIDPFHNDWPFW